MRTTRISSVRSRLRMVKTIIVSPQKMQEIKNSNLLVNFVDHNISLLTTVPVNEWSGTMMSKAQIKDVQIEDLLPRDPIQGEHAADR